MWIVWAYIGLAFAGAVLLWLIAWKATGAINEPTPSEDDGPRLAVWPADRNALIDRAREEEMEGRRG